MSDGRHRPALYTIPPERAFADDLVAGLFARVDADHDFALADYTIMLPNRRAVRAVRDAFLRGADGRPLLLPTLTAIGDVDEEAIDFLGAGFHHAAASQNPVISNKERQSLLMIQVDHWMRKSRTTPTAPAQNWRLAGDLMRLQDQIETEGLSYDGLKELVSDDFATHWQKTLDFLTIVSDHWPNILADLNRINPAEKRDQLIHSLIKAWTQMPPKGPVLIAGSTGTIPATRRLMQFVAGLPRGMIILPGLDTAMSDTAWDSLSAHPSHPQHVMQGTLTALRVDRPEVALWIKPDRSADQSPLATRLRLISDALLPSDAMGQWKEMDWAFDGELAAKATANLSLLTAANRREEAQAIALIMRSILETPGKTAALVTPDRLLATHVKSALKRWQIDIDDSAGDPATISQTGTYLQLLADLFAEDFAPLALIALLKHPYTAAGDSRQSLLDFARRLDLYVLRGPRPTAGATGLRRYAQQKVADPRSPFTAEDLAHLDKLLAFFDPVTAAFDDAQPFTVCLQRFLACAEALTSSHDSPGRDSLWRGDAGEGLAKALADLISDCASLPTVAATDFAPLLKEMIKGEVIRPKFGRHPRLQIWGTMEARLQRADVMILGGLNEGTWPQDPGSDPWMSREMRLRFGLPAFERKIGQSCHDFVQAMGAETVYLTRAEKVDGSPTVPSRWLLRLEALLGGLPAATTPYLQWAEALDKADHYAPVDPPQPTPPLDARPRELSVTQIETWMRDPYSLYARKILNLEKLDPLDARPSAADKGTIIHKILERFLTEKDGPQAGDPGLERLLDLGREEFQSLLLMPAVYAFWWPRFEQIAAWFITFQKERRASHRVALIEEKGSITLKDINFTLKAFADRIDAQLDSGAYEIIDYKTGTPPSEKRVLAGYAPQLPLEAFILQSGGFKSLPPGPVDALTYIHLKGGLEVVSVKNPVKDIETTTKEAAEGLIQLVKIFDDPKTPYLASPRSDITGYGDYDQLARVKEWQNSSMADTPAPAAGPVQPKGKSDA